jgi:hypothetical protein
MTDNPSAMAVAGARVNTRIKIRNILLITNSLPRIAFAFHIILPHCSWKDSNKPDRERKPFI